MIFDAETLPASWFEERVFDVCIIGSGPAGLTLARSLAAKGYHVALMEGGGTDITWDSEELYEGDSIGSKACRPRPRSGATRSPTRCALCSRDRRPRHRGGHPLEASLPSNCPYTQSLVRFAIRAQALPP